MSKPSQDIKYDINYDDKRFTEVEADKKAALNEVDVTYGNMINQSDKYYQKQIDAANEYAETQKKLQQERTDFTIQQINQQKEQTKTDYLKEQSGAYVDWQKQSGEYGANAEAMAAQGMANTGYSESAQVSMYNTYQNRVATAREAYARAVLNYDNAIKDAQLQNNAALAEIAYNALQTELELSLAGFQYKNSLITTQLDKKSEVDDRYYGRYQDVLSQINTENALAEEVRQYNANLAEEQRQYNNTLSLQKSQLQLERDKFSYQKQQDALKSAPISNGGGGGGGSSKNKKYGDGWVSTGGGRKSTTNTAKTVVSNRHTDSWVEIPGHGRFSWSEVLAHVKDGTIKEAKIKRKDGGYDVKYTWVGKQGNGKNVTPDAKGYTAKMANVFRDLDIKGR